MFRIEHQQHQTQDEYANEKQCGVGICSRRKSCDTGYDTITTRMGLAKECIPGRKYLLCNSLAVSRILSIRLRLVGYFCLHRHYGETLAGIVFSKVCPADADFLAIHDSDLPSRASPAPQKNIGRQRYQNRKSARAPVLASHVRHFRDNVTIVPGGKGRVGVGPSPGLIIPVSSRDLTPTCSRWCDDVFIITMMPFSSGLARPWSRASHNPRGVRRA